MGASRMRQEARQADADVLPPQPRQRRYVAPPPLAEDITDAHFVVIGKVTRPVDTGAGPDVSVGHVGVSKRFAFPAAVTERLEMFLEGFSDRAFAALVALMFGSVFMLASALAAYQLNDAEVPAGSLGIIHANATPQDADGMRMLLINGIVENRTGTAQPIPPIRADLYSGDQLVASTMIAPPVPVIEHGHSRGFAAKVPHPGGKSPDLRLSFVGRDAIAGQ